MVGANRFFFYYCSSSFVSVQSVRMERRRLNASLGLGLNLGAPRANGRRRKNCRFSFIFPRSEARLDHVVGPCRREHTERVRVRAKLLFALRGKRSRPVTSRSRSRRACRRGRTQVAVMVGKSRLHWKLLHRALELRAQLQSVGRLVS